MSNQADAIEILLADSRAALAFIDKRDAHLFKVRNWALITVSAVIAFGMTSGHPTVVWSTSILVLAFAYMEGVYKSLQNDVIDHARDIDRRIDGALHSGGEPDLDGFAFGFGGSIKQPTLKRALAVFRDPQFRHIVMFYFLLVVFSALSYFVGLIFSPQGSHFVGEDSSYQAALVSNTAGA